MELHTGQKIISMDVDMNGNDWQIFYSVHNRQENLWHIYKKTISSNGSNRNRRDVSPTKVCLTTGAVVPFCCKGTLEVSNIYIYRQSRLLV